MLEYRNNWCNNQYSVCGEKVSPKKVHVSGVGDFNVAKREENGTYNDMGHTYNYSTYEFHVMIESQFGLVHGPSLQHLLKQGYTVHVLEEE